MDQQQRTLPLHQQIVDGLEQSRIPPCRNFCPVEGIRIARGATVWVGHCSSFDDSEASAKLTTCTYLATLRYATLPCHRLKFPTVPQTVPVQRSARPRRRIRLSWALASLDSALRTFCARVGIHDPSRYVWWIVVPSCSIARVDWRRGFAQETVRALR